MYLFPVWAKKNFLLNSKNEWILPQNSKGFKRKTPIQEIFPIPTVFFKCINYPKWVFDFCYNHFLRRNVWTIIVQYFVIFYNWFICPSSIFSSFLCLRRFCRWCPCRPCCRRRPRDHTASSSVKVLIQNHWKGLCLIPVKVHMLIVSILVIVFFREIDF